MSAAQPLEPRAQAAIDAERLRLANRQVVRAPPGVLFAASFIGYMMAPHVGAALAWGWAGVAVGTWVLRAIVSAALLARPPAANRVRAWMRNLTLSTTASGMVAGSAAYLFFGAPPVEWAIMTMVLCAWGAAGIAVSGALPAAFVGLVTAFLAPLALAWSVSTMPLRLPVAGLILFFLFYLLVFARDSAALMARALRVGFDNEELAQMLRVREAEAQAARARAEEANRAKSRFLAAASHDLRQPLHSLTLLLDHAMHTVDDPKIGATLRHAARSADSLGRLLGGLLDLSRLDTGGLTPDFRPVSLQVLLRRLESDFRPLALDKGLALACATPEIWVLSDPAMLERVLRNLLDNAVKYTEAGRIELRVDDADSKVRVSVRDTGIGIDPADRERIFEEYYQVRNPARHRAQGSGLGLAIVKRMCELLGHPVDVESAPGSGSRFSVTLARCEPPGVHGGDSAPRAASFAALRDMVVVVIDDDEEVGEAMRTLLQSWGCRPVIAADSAAAIAQLEAARRDPDAILADWRLSGAENGLQAIARLDARFGERPAAIVTGEIDTAGLDITGHPAVSVMQKPVRASEIGDWLLRWATMA
ncbi:MAG TPA: HAMP domain-containing sensor histidine kinase [Albitalea sp.]|nr:HAMP domain-containing sensor histidine kinase [Albitalea sp.]